MKVVKVAMEENTVEMLTKSRLLSKFHYCLGILEVTDKEP